MSLSTTLDQLYINPAGASNSANINTNPPPSSKGSWLARVSHRASHIPNKPLHLSKSASRDTLPLRTPGSAGYATSHERLPGLNKTHSYPASPTSPQSPTSPVESEFGATPIDASFGERVDLPERPPYLTSARAGLPSQKSAGRARSSTAATIIQPGDHETLQNENMAAKKGRNMDKYARQAGDESYDSDGEADDEFERSVFTSPTLPARFGDDDASDHPSESEEEHDVVDGEDTPTTQGWADRDGRSPLEDVSQWSEEQVVEYLALLSPALKQYTQAFRDEGINGDALRSLHHDELRELGVASVGHRLTILKAVYEQKMRAGVRMEEGDYVPLSAEDEKGDQFATQDDFKRIIDSFRLRDERIMKAEAQLRSLKHDLERITEDNRKLREETLPIMRLVKDQRTPLPDPAGGTTLPSPRDTEPPRQQNENFPPLMSTKESKSSGLSRKFSTKKLFLGSAGPKQPSPTHPPQSHTPILRDIVRDDTGAHLEASAAAMAASSHLTASMTSSQPSPGSSHGQQQQLSPTSPAYSTQQAPPPLTSSSSSSAMAAAAAAAAGGSASSARSFARDPPSSARYDPRNSSNNSSATNTIYGYAAGVDDMGTAYSHLSQASTIVAEPPVSARLQDRSRRVVAPTPSPREEGDGRGDRDNPQVEIFKSFRVGIEDPCRVVLPVALKRYNITDDWRQYALYIVYGDQERCLGLEEKPLSLFKQLDREGRKPMFMMRRHASPQEGWSGAAGGGGPVETAAGGARVSRCSLFSRYAPIMVFGHPNAGRLARFELIADEMCLQIPGGVL